MNMREKIHASLMQGLSPAHLEVIDESHQHAGHTGARPGGETHYRVKIGAPAFAGQSRVACHRMVNAVLAPHLAAGVHALAIELLPLPGGEL